MTRSAPVTPPLLRNTARRPLCPHSWWAAAVRRKRRRLRREGYGVCEMVCHVTGDRVLAHCWWPLSRADAGSVFCLLFLFVVFVCCFCLLFLFVVFVCCLLFVVFVCCFCLLFCLLFLFVVCCLLFSLVGACDGARRAATNGGAREVVVMCLCRVQLPQGVAARRCGRWCSS